MIFKYIFLALETGLVLWALIQVNKKKKYLQMFPDGFKEQYYKATKIMTLLNLLSAFFILFSYLLIFTNYFFILSILSMFLSSHTILSIFEEFEGLENEKMKNKNSIEKRNCVKMIGKDNKILCVNRGEIYFADLGDGIGSEQQGVKPVVILQNDIGNNYSPTTIVALITSVNKKLNLPVHLGIDKKDSLLPKNSVILLEQIRTIDKQRLIRKISKLDDHLVSDIDRCLKKSLSLD